MQEIIKVEQLTKSYSKLLAVNNVGFSIYRGTVFGLLGANGAGKSTTIECILGKKKVDRYLFLECTHSQIAKIYLKKVGVQFQETNYQEQITVMELCEVTACLYRYATNPLDLLTKFGIADKQKSLVKDLSGGQRQRLFIVLALISKPEIVFLDELTTGLDEKARREGWKILSDLKEKGLTIF